MRDKDTRDKHMRDAGYACSCVGLGDRRQETREENLLVELLLLFTTSLDYYSFTTTGEEIAGRAVPDVRQGGAGFCHPLRALPGVSSWHSPDVCVGVLVILIFNLIHLNIMS